MAKNFVPQNSQYPRCVDGRVAAAFVEWDGVQWRMSKKGEAAAKEVGPQFLGASLLFVKVLEELAGKSRQDAMRMVEQASERLGWGLQIHIDNHHGEIDVESLSEAEVVEFATSHHVGCGFAKYAWGEAGDELIAAAKERHWRIQVLDGHHEEKGAVINYRLNYTFNTAIGVFEQQSRFNTDYSDAEKMFGVLGEMLKDSSFADKALSWMVETYRAVVVALKGVETPDQIEINE